MTKRAQPKTCRLSIDPGDNIHLSSYMVGSELSADLSLYESGSLLWRGDYSEDFGMGYPHGVPRVDSKLAKISFSKLTGVPEYCLKRRRLSKIKLGPCKCRRPLTIRYSQCYDLGYVRTGTVCLKCMRRTVVQED